MGNTLLLSRRSRVQDANQAVRKFDFASLTEGQLVVALDPLAIGLQRLAEFRVHKCDHFAEIALDRQTGLRIDIPAGVGCGPTSRVDTQPACGAAAR